MFATNLLIHIPFINFSSMAIVGMFRKLRGSDGEFECVSNFKVYQDYSIEDGVKGGKKSSRFSMGIHCVSQVKKVNIKDRNSTCRGFLHHLVTKSSSMCINNKYTPWYVVIEQVHFAFTHPEYVRSKRPHCLCRRGWLLIPTIKQEESMCYFLSGKSRKSVKSGSSL
jgi:hypothetical protein